MRTLVAVLAGLAVIYFGSTGRNPEEGGGISSGVLVLAGIAAALVWNLTKPGNNATK